MPSAICLLLSKKTSFSNKTPEKTRNFKSFIYLEFNNVLRTIKLKTGRDGSPSRPLIKGDHCHPALSAKAPKIQIQYFLNDGKERSASLY
jgi:hypothetical protein